MRVEDPTLRKTRLWEFSERKIVSVVIGDGSGDFRVSKAMRFWAHNPREGKRLLKRDVALREQEGEEVAPTRGGLEPSWPEPLTRGPSIRGPLPCGPTIHPASS